MLGSNTSKAFNCKCKYLISDLYLISIANTLKIRQCYVYVTYVICCHKHTHTHVHILVCAHTHSDLQWNIQMVFPLSFSPGIFEGLAHIFSRLFSFLFYISNARISNFAILNFASISIHCKYIELRLTQLYTLKLQQKMYLIATKYNYNVFDQLCHIPLASPWPVL